MAHLKESRLHHAELSLPDDNEQLIRGRSIFIVEATPKGILVQTSFEALDGRLLEMPAIFPNIEYAFTQIDAMRRLVEVKFAEEALKKKSYDDAVAFIAAHVND